MPEPIVVIDVIVPPPPVIDVAAIGVQGPPGVPGEDGEPGPPGPQGEPGPPGEGAGPHQASHAAGGADQIVGPLALGVNPAQSGAVRLANNQSVSARNAENTADVALISLATDNGTRLGSATGLIVNAPAMTVNGALEANQKLRFTEMAAPSAPGANQANVWLEDNGAGKSQLKLQTTDGQTTIAPEYHAIGQNPAQSGAVRLANNQSVSARNAANTADLSLIAANNADQVLLGVGATAIVFNAFTVIQNSVSLTSHLFMAGGGIQLNEIPAMGAGPANGAHLWIEDNGAGKSRLMVQFATGAAIQIAIEP